MPRLSSALQPSPQPFFDPAVEPVRLDDVVPEAPDVTAALWTRWRKEHDEAAREQLICHYLPYAKMVAATVYGRRTHNDVEFADYLQLARVGLLEAVDRFEPGQGAQFKTFAAKRVQGSVLNGLTRLTEKNQQISVAMRLRQERLEAVKDAAAAAEDAGDGQAGATASAGPRSADKLFKYLAEVGIGLALGVLLEDTGMVDGEAFDGNAHAPSPEVSYFRKTEILQLRTVLRDLVNQLSDQQKSVIRQHYLQEVPFDDIATMMGVTRGRVSQLHRQGLLRLRELLAKDARCDVSL
ncbi:sigma-70 family RNA polymerase sigma factor [Variovorax sp. 770b2]|uniref:sigma-70 family RNA polymerase sigma factor n=1 Tax=Variovorax sp. 770b2 TaxID=1566271 RepID=UPI0008EDFD7D|nr:sigma-70 family RNA polymerase sigma factor [Variovorax sp. 770b2]SFQ11230.1 RNA polymerase sigma factor for flagellar operon FliA [Variovorax sp. 770b2]